MIFILRVLVEIVQYNHWFLKNISLQITFQNPMLKNTENDNNNAVAKVPQQES